MKTLYSLHWYCLSFRLKMFFVHLSSIALIGRGVIYCLIVKGVIYGLIGRGVIYCIIVKGVIYGLIYIRRGVIYCITVKVVA